MKSAALIQALKKKFGQPTDKALSQLLGITPQILNNWRNGGQMQPMQMARLAWRLSNRVVAGEQLVEVLEKKLGGSESEFASQLGKSTAGARRLKNTAVITPKQIAALIKSSGDAARSAAEKTSVNDVEALLVRSFANNLLNKRTENFSAHRPSKRDRRSAG